MNCSMLSRIMHVRHSWASFMDLFAPVNVAVYIMQFAKSCEEKQMCSYINNSLLIIQF